jgi:hypothetical protein
MNEVAHRVAKMAVSSNVNQIGLTTTPPYIRDIVMAELADQLIINYHDYIITT